MQDLQKNAEWHKKNYLRIKNAIFALLGSKCVMCGFSDRRALQIDHINGGGSKERKIKYGRSAFDYILKEILGGSKKYQILCANCNWIKRAINNENRRA